MPSTIAAEGDIVLSMTSAELEGNWDSDLSKGEVASFDKGQFPDDVDDGDRVYFEMDDLLYAQATVREVGAETVWATGALGLRKAADCPVEMPDDGVTRLEEDQILPASDRNVSSDTVVDLEGSR